MENHSISCVNCNDILIKKLHQTQTGRYKNGKKWIQNTKCDECGKVIDIKSKKSKKGKGYGYSCINANCKRGNDICIKCYGTLCADEEKPPRKKIKLAKR